MTQQGNSFARQTAIRQNLDRLASPGLSADRAGRNSQNIGIVKAGTVQITATSYTADVEITTQYPGQLITIPRVRFGVPITEGDVVSLEMVGGDSRNGTFGTPIRPKGPRVHVFDGPVDANEWAIDKTAEPFSRAPNLIFQAYVIPIRVLGEAGVTVPIEGTAGLVTLATLPGVYRIETLPSAAHVSVKATLRGGLRIQGGDHPGDYAIRAPAAGLSVAASYQDIGAGIITSRIDAHVGLESARGSGRDVGNYPDMLNSPLRSNGESVLFARSIVDHPITVGRDFQIALLATTPRRSDFEYRRRIFHASYAHPAHSHQGTTHPAHEHPEDSYMTWDDLLAPMAGEQYSLWLGLSEVQITITSIGTGGG